MTSPDSGATDQREALAEAVRAFLAAYDAAEPYVQGIYTSAFVHGVKYNGPTYEAELAALRSMTKEPEE